MVLGALIQSCGTTEIFNLHASFAWLLSSLAH